MLMTMFFVKTETSEQIQRRIAEELYDGELYQISSCN